MPKNAYLELIDFDYLIILYNNMTKKLVENYKNVLKISDLRNYWLLRYDKNITSWIINLNDFALGLILDKDNKEWYLKTFVNRNDIIFNKLDTNDYWYVIHLITTKCNYGWFRWWFICPWSWKKCSHLYFHESWKFFSRKYLNLSYLEQNLSKNQRIVDEINWKYESKADILKSKIKYTFRKWIKTKKQKKLEKFESKIISIEQREQFYYNKISKFNLKI